MLGGESLWLMLVMVIVAVVSKVLGAGAGARLAGFSWLESLQFGVGMMSRGEVGLIVASVGISQGLISQGTYAAVVGVVIMTTLLTPPLLRLLFNRPERLAGAKTGGARKAGMRIFGESIPGSRKHLSAPERRKS